MSEPAERTPAEVAAEDQAAARLAEAFEVVAAEVYGLAMSIPRERPRSGSVDPWGRPWCRCGAPLEPHAHIPGSATRAWLYAPRPRPARRPVPWPLVLSVLGLLACLVLLAITAAQGG